MRTRGAEHEIDFWAEWIESDGSQWPEEFAKRLDPNLVFQLGEFLPDGRDMDVLDVGAGPLTWLGKVYPGRSITITAVDPLADVYAELLAAHGIAPLVPTRPGKVEALVDTFGPDRFHLVHMLNALDHSDDPIEGVRQMVRVCRPGCSVVLSHSTNEGTKANHVGMHQWDLRVEDGRFLVVNAVGHALDVAKITMGTARVEVVSADANWNVVRLMKEGK